LKIFERERREEGEREEKVVLSAKAGLHKSCVKKCMYLSAVSS